MDDKPFFDIAVIGGGLAGLTQAIVLGRQGWSVICIDRETPQTHQDKNYDIRTTAISWGSRNFLLNAGIWQNLDGISEPIRDILILDEDSPQTLEFNAEAVDKEAFGWIIDNRDLRLALYKEIQMLDTVTHLTGQAVTDFHTDETNVTISCTNNYTCKARLVIGADGRNSFTREAMEIGTWEKDYKQNAIVCLITHEKPHKGLAIEHFMAQGPFAVLPYTNDDQGRPRSAIVWTVERRDSESWLAASDDIFIAALEERLQGRFSTITQCGPRAAFPLSLKKSYSYIAPRMVLIAEAAHGIHPIAGQGLNMSLRDIAALTEIIGQTNDPGDINILKSYQAKRRGDNLSMAVATDALNDLFGMNISPVRAIRRAGLSAVANLPFAKKFFMKQAMGAGGSLPALVRDHPVSLK